MLSSVSIFFFSRLLRFLSFFNFSNVKSAFVPAALCSGKFSLKKKKKREMRDGEQELNCSCLLSFFFCTTQNLILKLPNICSKIKWIFFSASTSEQMAANISIQMWYVFFARCLAQHSRRHECKKLMSTFTKFRPNFGLTFSFYSWLVFFSFSVDPFPTLFRWIFFHEIRIPYSKYTGKFSICILCPLSTVSQSHALKCVFFMEIKAAKFNMLSLCAC